MKRIAGNTKVLSPDYEEIIGITSKQTGIDRLVLTQVYLSFYEEIAVNMRAPKDKRDYHEVSIIKLPSLGEIVPNMRFFSMRDYIRDKHKMGIDPYTGEKKEKKDKKDKESGKIKSSSNKNK